jgi:hypothetical protein
MYKNGDVMSRIHPSKKRTVEDKFSLYMDLMNFQIAFLSVSGMLNS